MWRRERKGDPPLPPVELRKLVGPTEPGFYDNPNGRPLFEGLSSRVYDVVLDFGCGCGRLARQLIQQEPRPRRYIGVDLHRGMVSWCRRELSPYARGFEFHHHNVRNAGLNPSGTEEQMPLPAAQEEVTLFIAWSVFTHVLERSALHYLRELSRVLHPDGVAVTTWFLFEKSDFPMMQEFQNALFINDTDPTNAVIFDKGWLRGAVEDVGLVATRIVPPDIRGFQWRMYLMKAGPSRITAEFPEDLAPCGVERPPLLPEGADELGLDSPET